jgi:hypothetical protein
MANISRDTFDSTKHYRKIILQQGVPWVDADFNESQDSQVFYLRKMIIDCIGNGTPDDGFKIVENSILHGGTGDLNNKFLIQLGSYYIDGYCGLFESGQEYTTQADWSTWDGAGEPSPQVPFTSTPPSIAPPAVGTRDDKIILCIWENEIDGVEDPNIIEPTLLVECSRRLKVMCFIYVTPGSVPVSNETHKYAHLATIHRIAGKDSIEDGDITDARSDISSKLAAIDERVDNLETEVWGARGTHLSLDGRLDIGLEDNGKLKFSSQENGIQKEANTQIMDFQHGLDVTSILTGKVQIDVDEDEFDFDFARFSNQLSDPATEATKGFLYFKTIAGKGELHVKDNDGNIQQLTSGGYFVAGLQKEVRMWYGLLSEIPIGWYLCDGTSGRPNLINKFIQCVSSVVTNPGNEGGAHSITLAIANLPAHSHTIATSGSHTHSGSTGTTSATHTHSGTTGAESATHAHTVTINSGGDHTHQVNFRNVAGPSGSGGPSPIVGFSPATIYTNTVSAGSHSHTNSVGTESATHTHTITTGNESASHTHSISSDGGHIHTESSVGNDSSFDNRPAYYELAFIAR